MLNKADIARRAITLGALCFSSNDVIAKKNVFMPVFAYLQARWEYDSKALVLHDNESQYFSVICQNLTQKDKLQTKGQACKDIPHGVGYPIEITQLHTTQQD
jgi:hypothetical protein